MLYGPRDDTNATRYSGWRAMLRPRVLVLLMAIIWLYGFVVQYAYCDNCDPGGLSLFANGVPWVHDLGANLGLTNHVCTQFLPGIADNDPQPYAECDQNNNGIRDDCEP